MIGIGKNFTAIVIIIFFYNVLSSMQSSSHELMNYLQKKTLDHIKQGTYCTLKNNGATISYPLSNEQACLSEILKSKIKSEKNPCYEFKHTLHDSNIENICKYLESYGTSYQKITENLIIQGHQISKTFKSLYLLLTGAHELKIQPLIDFLNSYLLTHLLNNKNLAQTVVSLNKNLAVLVQPKLTLPTNIIAENIISPNGKFILFVIKNKNTNQFSYKLYSCDKEIASEESILESENYQLEWAPNSSFFGLKKNHTIVLGDIQKFHNQKKIDFYITIQEKNSCNFNSFTMSPTSKNLFALVRTNGYLYDCIDGTCLNVFNFDVYVFEKPLFTRDGTSIILALNDECAMFSCKTKKKLDSYGTISSITSMHFKGNSSTLMLEEEQSSIITLIDVHNSFTHHKTIELGSEQCFETMFDIKNNSATSIDNDCYILKKSDQEKDIHKPDYSCPECITKLTFHPKVPYLLIHTPKECVFYNLVTQQAEGKIEKNCFSGARVTFSKDDTFLFVMHKESQKIYCVYNLQELLVNYYEAQKSTLLLNSN